MMYAKTPSLDWSTLERAIRFAVAHHTGVKDKGGDPYSLHPLRVMMDLWRQGILNVAILSAAVLHDTVEDPDCNGKRTTLAEIRNLFGDHVARLVSVLTKRPGEKHWDYIERVYLDGEARLIKLADIRDNMDLRRITDEHGMYSRYAKAYHYLTWGPDIEELFQ